MIAVVPHGRRLWDSHPFRSSTPQHIEHVMTNSTVPKPAIPAPKEVASPASLIFRGIISANALGGTGIGALAVWFMSRMADHPKFDAWIFGVGVVASACVLTVMGNAIYSIWEDANEFRALLVAEREARVNDTEDFNGRLRAEQEKRSRDREAYERSRVAVVTAVEHPYSPYGSCKCVLIVDWPAQIALQPATHVTISTDMGTYERPLGSGWVRPKETNGKSVVTLDTPYRDAEPFITALLNKTAGEAGLLKIRIGPAADLQNISHSPGTSGEVPSQHMETATSEGR